MTKDFNSLNNKKMANSLRNIAFRQIENESSTSEVEIYVLKDSERFEE